MKTMNTAHTPGPWTPARSDDKRTGCEVRGGTKLQGADRAPLVCRVSNYIPLAEREANARLIAAAPDLLAACKAALTLAWEVGSESEDGVLTLLDDSRGDLYRQLSAALAKVQP